MRRSWFGGTVCCKPLIELVSKTLKSHYILLIPILFLEFLFIVNSFFTRDSPILLYRRSYQIPSAATSHSRSSSNSPDRRIL